VPVNVSEVGERTLVSIRPERVEYNKDRLQPGAHTVHAEVLEFIYMGDIYRTRLRVAGKDDFIIKTRNAPDQRRLKPGEKIEIGWRPQDCRALDALTENPPRAGPGPVADNGDGTPTRERT
jgi:putative spermidine/putrescine transport system ATP-binding protein